MIILDCEQLSPEWFAARAGIPSASRFNEIVTATGAPSKQQTKYMYQLAGERITGVKVQGFQSASMRRGIELEPEAQALYQMMSGAETQQVGLVYPDERKRYSCSPDLLVGANGGMELKCPEIHTHVKYLLDGRLPGDYHRQVHGSMMVSGREWWDFMSYYPGMKPFILRIQRDETLIGKLRDALEAFCDELDILVEKLRDA